MSASKLIDLEWNVYYENINSRKIMPYNVFNHHFFTIGCAKAAKKCMSRTEFAEEVKHELMYYFWSKCEWEILLVSWTSPEDEKRHCKIDVYNQVMLNYDRFIDYLWDNRKELRKLDTKEVN